MNLIKKLFKIKNKRIKPININKINKNYKISFIDNYEKKEVRKTFSTIMIVNLVKYSEYTRKIKNKKFIFKMLTHWFESVDNILNTIKKEDRPFLYEIPGDCLIFITNHFLTQKNHADIMVKFAFKLINLSFILNYLFIGLYDYNLQIRIGINTGFIYGTTLNNLKNLQNINNSHYRIIGDAINIAKRMEEICSPYCINISKSTKNNLTFKIKFKEMISIIKHYGKVKSYINDNYNYTVLTPINNLESPRSPSPRKFTNKIIINKKILIVDDSPSTCKRFNYILKKFSEPIICYSGIEAIELIKKYTFNIILIDINMEELTGFQTVKQIRNLEEKKIVKNINTIYGMTSDVITNSYKLNALACGMDNLFQKKFSYDDLFNLVNQ